MIRTLRYLAIALLSLTSCGLAQGPVDAVDGQRAYGFLLRQVGFGPRNPGSAGHEACLAYLVQQLSASVDTVELMRFQPFDSEGNRVPPLTNIIGRIAPERATRYLFAAHWDTRPRADQDPRPERRDEPILGANDGASGVAVLLEAASVFAQHPPPVGIDIVLFDGEDYGKEGNLNDYLLGSRELARRWLHYKPELGILVDMVGDKDLHLPKERISFNAAPWLVNRVWDIAGRIGERAFVTSVGEQIYDDHVPLLQAGWPVIDVIDFAYPYWHTLADTPDKCSPRSLRAVSRVLVALAYGY